MGTRWLWVAAALVVGGCTARRIPGTDIQDTPESRAILEVMEKYRKALENRDAPAMLALVSPSFKDDAGSATPIDDLDYELLQKQLPERMSKLQDVRLAVDVKKILMHPENKASAVFYFSTTYQVPGSSGQPRSDSDIKEMWFRREGDAWKIVSGI
jgi:hypothetical protein